VLFLLFLTTLNHFPQIIFIEYITIRMMEKRLRNKTSNCFWLSTGTFPFVCSTPKPEILAAFFVVQNSITVPSEIVEVLTERFSKIFVRQISLPPYTAETLLSYLTD